MSKTIYLLYSCDDWKTRTGMQIILATTNRGQILKKIAKEIKNGGMLYQGEKGAEAAKAFLEDNKNNSTEDITGYIQYGFVESFNDGEELDEK